MKYIVDGETIKSLREVKKMTQPDLSSLTAIDVAHISRIESGKKQNVEVSTLGRIASALNVNPGLLIKSV